MFSYITFNAHSVDYILLSSIECVHLGIVIATETSPNPRNFHFIISEQNARKVAENGTFLQVISPEGSSILAKITNLLSTNKYFNTPDLIHGSASGLAPPQVYPSGRWDYLIGEAEVLGEFHVALYKRATRPVAPGSDVEIIDPLILKKFLGFTGQGLNLGKLRQMDADALLNIDRLLQKHLAILSISGGGKSYFASVLIEEVLKRKPSLGRPALVLFDVHGEFGYLQTINGAHVFPDAEVKVISSESLKIAVGHLKPGDFANFEPAMTSPQIRELSRIFREEKAKAGLITLSTIITRIQSQASMNQLTQDALLSWLYGFNSTRIFDYYEEPAFEEELHCGKLLILDFSQLTSLRNKQILVSYFLKRIFQLRRENRIPPTVTFIEEAHQFCPETTTSPAKRIIETIAREGRKFLTNLVLISQRPINLSNTALSQCNSHILLKIMNPNDLQYISKTSEGLSQEALKLISSLGVGEAIIVGNAVNYPIFIQVRERLCIPSTKQSSLALQSREFERIFAKAKNRGQ